MKNIIKQKMSDRKKEKLIQRKTVLEEKLKDDKDWLYFYEMDIRQLYQCEPFTNIKKRDKYDKRVKKTKQKIEKIDLALQEMDQVQGKEKEEIQEREM